MCIALALALMITTAAAARVTKPVPVISESFGEMLPNAGPTIAPASTQIAHLAHL